MRGKRSWVVGLMLAGALAPSARAATAPRPIYWGVSYGPSPSETATVFAQSHPGAPVVVLVHGGGWRLQKLASSRRSPPSGSTRLAREPCARSSR
jgi:acetyl esterase/lipase